MANFMMKLLNFLAKISLLFLGIIYFFPAFIYIVLEKNSTEQMSGELDVLLKIFTIIWFITACIFTIAFIMYKLSGITL